VNHYTYRAEWSPERSEYVGRCIEMPWLARWAPTLREAIAAIDQAVDECIAERIACGDGTTNRAAIQRQICGQNLTGAACTARGPVEAAEQNVSMNQWVIQKLADRQPSALFDL
jgi:HicB family